MKPARKKTESEKRPLVGEELDLALLQAGVEPLDAITAEDLAIIINATEVVDIAQLAQASNASTGFVVDALARARSVVRRALGARWPAATFEPVDLEAEPETPAPGASSPPGADAPAAPPAPPSS